VTSCCYYTRIMELILDSHLKLCYRSVCSMVLVFPAC